MWTEASWQSLGLLDSANVYLARLIVRREDRLAEGAPAGRISAFGRGGGTRTDRHPLSALRPHEAKRGRTGPRICAIAAGWGSTSTQGPWWPQPGCGPNVRPKVAMGSTCLSDPTRVQVAVRRESALDARRPTGCGSVAPSSTSCSARARLPRCAWDVPLPAAQATARTRTLSLAAIRKANAPEESGWHVRTRATRE